MITLIVTGFVGNDAELKYLPDGTPVAKFSIASNRKAKSGDVTTWLRVSLFGKHVETAAEHVKKGACLSCVCDRLEASAYTKDGEARASLEAVATSWQFVGAKRDAEQVPF